MHFIQIKDIYKNQKEYAQKEIEIAGWIRTIRSSKSFGFLELNDGTFFKNIQIVLEQQQLSNYDDIVKLNIGTAVIVKGILEQTPQAKQPFELKASEVIVEGNCDSSYPLQKKRHSFEYLRKIAYLRPRTNTFSAVFRVRSFIAYAIHTFFQEKGFVYVHTPIITGSDCEGAGEMFSVTTLPLKDIKNMPVTESGDIDFTKDFFGKQTNLTVSGQLSGETFAMAFRNIYTFGPTFRAENSNTARHAAEFWMIEPEMAFADLEDNMQIAEEMLKYIISFVSPWIIPENLLNSAQKAAINFHPGPPDYPGTGCYNFALYEGTKKYGVTAHHMEKKVDTGNIRINDDDKTVAAMDLLVPNIGEIIGGSQREERLDKLEKRMQELSMKKEDYWWYMDLRRYGGTRHAGFGLGFERAVMYLTGMSNIRDVIPYPRTVHNAEY